MMPVGFSPALDGVLRTGAGLLGQALRDHIAQYVYAQQRPDGRYRSRLGHSDLYYTDFGLRTLGLLHIRQNPLIQPTIISAQPKDILECFTVLNIRRMQGFDDATNPLDVDGTISIINRQCLPTGGFARPTGTVVSAYHTFLAVLCYEMLGVDVPDQERIIQALTALRRPDGGYCEMAGEPYSQTNATAASVACLTLLGGINADEAAQTAGFLASMQSTTGGLRAVPLIDEADLLSTFTGMVCLAGLGDLACLDLMQTARFIIRLLTLDGGFRACDSDGEADIEYTYYGLGALSLLKVYSSSSSNNEV